MKTKTIHISQKLEKFGIFFGLSLIILMIILAIFAHYYRQEHKKDRYGGD